MEISEALPTGESGASIEDRLTALLSADDATQEAPAPENQAKADAQEPTDEPEKVDADDKGEETPNEYQLSDVAKLLGADESALDVDEDGSVLIKTKIDGQDGKVKFSDLVKSYQLQGHVDKQVREAAEVRKQAQEYAQQVQQQTQVQQAVVGLVAEAKAIEAKYAQWQEIDLVALWDSDPAQAGKINQVMLNLQSEWRQKMGQVDQAKQHISQTQAQHNEASLQSERQALMKACPEWSNDATATKEKQAITADLLSRGYTQMDIEGLSDHKAVLLARDAMLYRQQKEAAKTTEKQVRAAPKITKPGSTSARNTNAIQKIHQEVRRTGSRQSTIDYLLATGKV